VKCPKCERVYPIARGDEVICPCGNRFPVKGNEVVAPVMQCDELQLREATKDRNQGPMSDVEYFEKNLFATLGIPRDLQR